MSDRLRCPSCRRACLTASVVLEVMVLASPRPRGAQRARDSARSARGSFALDPEQEARCSRCGWSGTIADARRGVFKRDGRWWVRTEQGVLGPYRSRSEADDFERLSRGRPPRERRTRSDVHRSRLLAVEPFGRWVAERAKAHGSLSKLAEVTTVDEAHLRHVRDGRQRRVHEDVVDRALTAEGSTRLQDLYP